VLVTLGSFYGGILFLLCNSSQHIGLTDNVPDFRLCSRTIILSPVVRFLYWHMNFHIEHHMYAAVPCYRLGRLHKAIRHDLPPTSVGLIATWREIFAIVERQETEPDYQYLPELPKSISVA
ncbi:MAG: fatty acid desaturase, partial [Candidatus Latescibacterota bacterium]